MKCGRAEGIPTEGKGVRAGLVGMSGVPAIEGWEDWPSGLGVGVQAQGLSLDATSPKELLLAPGQESEGREGFGL